MESHDRMQLAAHQPLKGGNLLVIGLWMRSAIALLDGLDLDPPARLERDAAPRMPSTARAPASS